MHGLAGARQQLCRAMIVARQEEFHRPSIAKPLHCSRLKFFASFFRILLKLYSDKNINLLKQHSFLINSNNYTATTLIMWL